MRRAGEALLPMRGRAWSPGAVGLVLATFVATLVCITVTWGPSMRSGLLGRAAKHAPTQKLDASFDADTLYSDKKVIDMDHPNRIDSYGCMFSDCDASGNDDLMTKVQALKRQLSKLGELQKQFQGALKKPVSTTIQVLPGAPGLLGLRGKRGPTGPQGNPGDQGPQGRRGLKGRPGVPGKEGDRGLPGPVGDPGDSGPAGPPGPAGPVGLRGPNGDAGDSGVKGPPGYPGALGAPGMIGAKGNRGPRGIQPVGPPGPPGEQGGVGQPGEKGPPGDQGPEGLGGESGQQGDPGINGLRGPPGKDAKQMPPPQCTGVTTVAQEGMCCGRVTPYWAREPTGGSMAYVDTSACKFADDNVKYFTTMTANDWFEWAKGMTSVLEPSQNGFKKWVSVVTQERTDYNFLSPSIKWCGVGKQQASAPKVQNLCCGRSTNENEHIVYLSDDRSCQISDPQFTVALDEPYDSTGNHPTDPSSFYGFSRIIGGSSGYDRYISLKIWWTSNKGYQYNSWGSKWYTQGASAHFCQAGSAFPTGDMDVVGGRAQPDEYPCKGVRMLKTYDNYDEDGRIDTDKGRLCCGETRPQDWENYQPPFSGWGLKATVDISKCNFRDPPYLMTSLACNDVSCGVINGGGAFNTLTTTSFKAYVRSTVSDNQQKQNAINGGWRYQWCAMGKT